MLKPKLILPINGVVWVQDLELKESPSNPKASSLRAEKGMWQTESTDRFSLEFRLDVITIGYCVSLDAACKKHQRKEEIK